MSSQFIYTLYPPPKTTPCFEAVFTYCEANIFNGTPLAQEQKRLVCCYLTPCSASLALISQNFFSDVAFYREQLVGKTQPTYLRRYRDKSLGMEFKTQQNKSEAQPRAPCGGAWNSLRNSLVNKERQETQLWTLRVQQSSSGVPFRVYNVRSLFPIREANPREASK